MPEAKLSVYKLPSLKLIKSILRIGETGLIVGKRGYGKTHTTIILMEGALKLGYVVFTNIIFVKRVANTGDDNKDFVEANPEGVYRCESIAQMYEMAARIHLKDPEKNIVLIVDELGESAHAYRSSSRMSYIFSQSQGTMRKHRIACVLANPSYQAIPKELRRYAGWVIYKHAGKANRFVKQLPERPRIDPKKRYAFLVDSERNGEVIVEIPGDKLCKPENKLKVGEMSYDTYATASFIEGPPWFIDAGGMEKLREIMGNRSHHTVARAVLDWMAEQKEQQEQAKHGNAKVEQKEYFRKLYREHPAWRRRTTLLADKCGVTPKTITNWRRELIAEDMVGEYANDLDSE